MGIRTVGPWVSDYTDKRAGKGKLREYATVSLGTVFSMFNKKNWLHRKFIISFFSHCNEPNNKENKRADTEVPELNVSFFFFHG